MESHVDPRSNYARNERAMVSGLREAQAAHEFNTGSDSGRSLRLLRDEQREKKGYRRLERRQLRRFSSAHSCRHAGKKVMTTEMPGMVFARVAVMLVRRPGVVMMRVNGLMRVGGKAGESGKCCGPSLKREQKQNNYRDPFMPDCHERVQSIEKPKSLQPTTDDIFRRRKVLVWNGCRRERIGQDLPGWKIRKY
jgi:hypothetical protein